MKRLLLFLVAGCLLRQTAVAGYVIDLETSNELKTLFDGGLRPIHVNGLEMSDLELPEPTEVSFRLGGITTPPLLAEWSFSVYYDRGLARVKGYSRQPMTKEETYEVLSRWDTALGYAKDLPVLRSWIDNFPNNKGDRDLWGRKVFKNVPGVNRYVSYYLRHSFSEEKPFLMTVHLSWYVKGPQKIVFGKEPLKAPPGYESHDMRSLELRRQDQSLNQQTAPPAPLRVTSEKKTQPPPPTPEKSPEQTWWKWVLVLLASALVVHRLWKSYRASDG